MSNDQSPTSSQLNESLSSKEIQHIFSHDESKNANPSKKTVNVRHNEKDLVSIIYYQKKDSPKYFEIKKSVFFWWFVILPAITLLSASIAIFAAIHLSPTHLLQNYLSAKNYSAMKSEIEVLLNEKDRLLEELKTKNNEIIKLKQTETTTEDNPAAIATNTKPTNTIDAGQPKTQESTTSKTNVELDPVSQDSSKKLNPQALGLNYLSIFKPVQGQKDRTRPAQISLSGFNVVTLRDTINFKFNITPLLPNEQKIAGHILVIMKGETGLQVYPQMSLNAPDAQISYSAGESFATQRFRPVDANFLKPRKSGQFVFTVLIFARNGDLIHTQTVPLFVRL